MSYASCIPILLSNHKIAESLKSTTAFDSFMTAITRHEVYYLEDGNLVLLAETTLFKIHRSQFMFSPLFKDMLSLPQSPDDPPQGFSDSNPIDIGGSDIPAELGVSSITAEDFSDFLSVMYPMTYPGGLTRSAESWGRVLKASTMLQFEPIRVMAIMNLSASDPLLMVQLGVDHHHEPLVVEGIKRLCLCPKPIPMDATLVLSATTFYHLSSAREAIRTHLARKVNTEAFKHRWRCPQTESSCAQKITIELADILMPYSKTPPWTEHIEDTNAFHVIAKENLGRLQAICDYCVTSLETKIERIADFSAIDDIIKNTIQEISDIRKK